MTDLTDWHIHSRHSPCGHPDSDLARVVREARAQGLSEFGLSDHLHCRLNLPALEAARAAFDALGPPPGAHFGLEVSCLRRWDLEQNDALGERGSIYGVRQGGPADGELTVYLPAGAVEMLRPEYIIGGAHWPLGAELEPQSIIRSYHRQYLFLAAHPQVDVVAHPWWWMGAWQDADGVYRTHPWLGDFGVVPRSLHEEFAAAAVRHGKAVEINIHAMLTNHEYPAEFRRTGYPRYLALLRDLGVRFSIGSDSHSAGYEGRLEAAAEAISRLGLRPDDLWRPDRR